MKQHGERLFVKTIAGWKSNRIQEKSSLFYVSFLLMVKCQRNATHDFVFRSLQSHIIQLNRPDLLCLKKDKFLKAAACDICKEVLSKFPEISLAFRYQLRRIAD